MFTVNIKNVFFSFSNLLQKADVMRLKVELLITVHRHILISWLNSKSGEEFLELGLKFICVDICTPENLGV